MPNFLFVFVGGGLGSLLRYGAALLSPSGTFVVNITGSFLIGFFATLMPVQSPWRLLIVTGFLGGYTTFSAFEWQLFTAVQSGFPWQAAGNAAASVVLGFVACWAGAYLAGTIATMLK